MSPESKVPVPWRYVVLFLLGADIVSVTLALIVGYWLRYRAELFSDFKGYDDLTGPVCLAIWIGALALSGGYKPTFVGAGFEEYRRLAIACTVALLGVVMTSYILAGPFPVSRAFLFISWFTTISLLVVGRFAARRLVRRLVRTGLVLRRVLIVGANPQGVSLAEDLASDPSAGCVVVGFLDDYKPVASSIGGRPILGDPLQLLGVAREHGVTQVVVVESGLSWESRQHVMEVMHSRRDPQILMAAGMLDLNATPMQLVQVGSTLMLESHGSRIVGLEATLKRALDLVVAGPLALVALPCVGAYLAGVKLAGARNRVVWRRVLLRYGRTIEVPNLRSDRLARLHLTRLPELWWVLGGQMSFVGPRPLTADEADRFRPWHEVFTMKPGVVGPWWLAGKGRPSDVEEEIALDLRYARTYTLWQDLSIVVRVAAAVLRGRFPIASRAGARTPRDAALDT